MGRNKNNISKNGYDLAWLALATGLLPFVVVHIAFIASAIQGYIPACNPYLDGCASISASGRHGFSYIFFKMGMIPAALLLAVFWLVCRLWLLQLGDKNILVLWLVAICGGVSAVFLVLYTVYLGSEGDFYRFMRRIGVIVYFAFSYLAQLLLLARLQRLKMQNLSVLPGFVLTGKTMLVGGLMIFGLASIPVGNFVDDQLMDKDRVENIIEWWFSLMMVCYYFLTWFAWRACKIRLQIAPLRVVEGRR